MSSPLETQAKVWVDTISSEETVSTYKAVLQTLIAAVTALWEALKVSWTIIRETGKLAWLFICFGLVASDWLWDSSKRLIEKIKSLTSHAGDPKSDTYIIDTSKAILEASKTGAVKAVKQAREQLGLPKDGAPVAQASPAQASGSTVAPSPTPSAPTAPVAPTVAPPKAEPSTTNATSTEEA